ncbi:MAG: hypothetical protein JSW62_03030 [Thermoplasmatales archaeon]|nr:MAG: hypothetical protein JSW62_03030 [Thermoplasmatales archaeon]
MSIDESIDELVDRLIDKAEKSKTDVETKEIRPEPFRYIIDKEEIKSELSKSAEKTPSISVMKLPKEIKMVDGKECLAGLGDADTIESIIQRHIQIRKLRGR